MKTKQQKSDFSKTDEDVCSCEIQAVTTVDDRGQIVIPKEVRDAAGIKPGDKLAVIFLGKKEEKCCVSLMKADQLSNAVKITISPLLGQSK